MKKIKIVLLCCMTTMLFVSCSDDDEGTSEGPSLEAKWELKKIGKIDEDGAESLSDYENPSDCNSDSFELLDDGSTKCLSYSKPEGSEECVEGVVAGTWYEEEGGTFTMTFPGDYKRTYEVLELTTSSLKIKFVKDEPETQAADADNLWLYQAVN